jgi:hypothetical protein
MTPKLLAANRANGRLSAGPRSEQGKRQSSMNGLKHGIFAKALETSISELGEDAADYESLRRGLHATFGPQDALEEMLVEEMAQLSWRRNRLMRAESGLLASKRRSYEIKRALKGSSHAGGARKLLRGAINPMLGYAGLPDSVDKCARVIEVLQALRGLVLFEGFKQEHEKYFKLLYGQMQPLGGANLRAIHEASRRRVEAGEQQPDDYESFVSAVNAEIAAYKKLQKLCKAKDLDTTEAMKDARLLPSDGDVSRILRYERGLARQFRSKLQQFVGWRQAKKGMLLYADAETDGEGTSRKQRGLSACAAEPLSVGEAIDLNIS